MGNDPQIIMDGIAVPTITVSTVVVGTGSAGFCAAEQLHALGHQDIAMVTDRVNTGTSRNAGSDKQTYYKLTLAGSSGDSVHQMANTLYSGGSMDGENALVEAALSPHAFLHLVDLGVPFPRNRWGEYVGYKTDHDPAQRATSAGPYTSRMMVQQLEKRVLENETPIVDNVRIVDVLVDDGKVVGLLCLKRDVTEEECSKGASRFLLIQCTSIVYATGGPAGMYARSVFPHGQWGASGAAYRAGVAGKNLTEWQFGLASIAPRWNVSGTYMQALPRFISTAADGSDEREFLGEAIGDYGRQLSLIFLKGYQWPFDIRKVTDGSSLIDLLVYRETYMRGRRVFLDFTRNPMCDDLDADALNPEARQYLERAGALFGTPIERLRHMNEPAYQLYRQKNPYIDLEMDTLEIDVCVQHNNGGLVANEWWQSNIEGFFPIGEAAGSHGVYRPGGAALNSGQVGAMRASQWIVRHRADIPTLDLGTFETIAHKAVLDAATLLEQAFARCVEQDDNTADFLEHYPLLMSEKAGPVRSLDSVSEALSLVEQALTDFGRTVSADASSRRSVERVFLVRDILTTQFVYLSAMHDYLEHGGHSRGSVLYSEAEGEMPTMGYGEQPNRQIEGLPPEFRFQLDAGAFDDLIQHVHFLHDEDQPQVSAQWRNRHPLPDTSNDFFENVWKEYRETGNIV